MKINCLMCGHKVDLDDAYDDYVGEVKCFVCGSLLEIRTEHGAVQSARRASQRIAGSAPAAGQDPEDVMELPFSTDAAGEDS